MLLASIPQLARVTTTRLRPEFASTDLCDLVSLSGKQWIPRRNGTSPCDTPGNQAVRIAKI